MSLVLVSVLLSWTTPATLVDALSISCVWLVVVTLFVLYDVILVTVPSVSVLFAVNTPPPLNPLPAIT